MTKGFPKTTVAILTGVIVCYMGFGVIVQREGEGSWVAGFLMVPWFAFFRVTHVGVSLTLGVFVALVFWATVGGIAYLSWTKRRVIYPVILILYPALAYIAAWRQAVLMWKS